MYRILQINFDIVGLSTFKINPIPIINSITDYWIHFLKWEGTKKETKKLDHLSTSTTQFIIFHDLTIQSSSKQEGRCKR